MPFKSEKQRRLFWHKVDTGEMPKSTALEWEHATKNKKSLPKYVSKKAYVMGKIAALQKLGFDAEAFAQAVQQDDTDEFVDQNRANPENIKKLDKPPGWSDKSTMDAGDGAARNLEASVPRFGGV